ncbi:MAG TPA: GNAT family N-acetyltransferase [Blastocatellia bacterium]|nr:GNAT family N-acetyltransferase [Blastocatellia bacterium]
MMNKKPILTIRRATSDDASLLAELGAKTFYETFAVDNRPEDMAAYLAASFSPSLQAKEITDPNTTLLIAEIEGKAAGYAKLEVSAAPPLITGPNPIELSRLYVSRAFIGSGVGAALMESCIGEAKSAGKATLWLGVWEKNERAQRFYKRWEFQEVGEHTFLLGSDAQRDLLMQRDIESV